MYMRRLILVVIASLVVSSCGFHLRGQLPISEAANVIYVDAEPGEFRTELIERLQINGATVVDTEEAAKITLKINDVFAERETSTIDQRGKVNSFTVYYIVRYVVKDKEGEQLQNNRLQESRQYTFDPTQVLQQEREEEDLIEAMREEILVRLVRQLSVL